MEWDEAVRELTTEAVQGRAALAVSGVHYDSRRVGAGDVFVAMRGESSDGNQFVHRALLQGAAGIVTDSAEVYRALRRDAPAVGLAQVQHGRRALAEISAAVFGHPERALKISAVTGTNGKTTTAWVLEQLLRENGRRCCLVGTIETHIADAVLPSPHTTPESRDLLSTFAQAREAGCTEAVIEASSHALAQERLWSIPVDVAMWTNLTQDHLDFHGSMEDYFAAKTRLFLGLGTPAPRVAVVNRDAAYGYRIEAIAREAGSEVWTYGFEAGASVGSDVSAGNVQLRAGETAFDLQTPAGRRWICSPLTGRVNLSNLLAACAAALARGLSLEGIIDAAERLRQVPGRFEVVTSGGTHPTVVVDYAHTDDALRNLVGLARDLADVRGGRVITLFGCGGDRDRTKRPKMGRAAGERSDLVVVTSDNPRSESPTSILEEILPGVRETGARFFVEEDRRAAIRLAIEAATARDLVLLAGKGHEKTQIFADGAVPFDDVAEARAVLEQIRERRGR